MGYKFTNDLKTLREVRGQLRAPTKEGLLALLIAHHVVKETTDDCAMTDDAPDSNQPITKTQGHGTGNTQPPTPQQKPTIPQGSEKIQFNIERTKRMDRSTFDLVTSRNGKELQRYHSMTEVGIKAYVGDSRGIIPQYVLFLLEKVQNAMDACGCSTPTGEWGDALTAVILALLAMGFQISYEVERNDEGRKSVNIEYDGKYLSIANVSEKGITELALWTNHSSKPDNWCDRTHTIQDTIDAGVALFSGGVPTQKPLFKTTLRLEIPAGMRTEKFGMWCGRLVHHVDVTKDKCFVQWGKQKCAMYFRLTTSSMVLIYWNHKLLYANKVPGVERGIVIQIVSNERDRGPTDGRDRTLSKLWLSKSAPEHLAYDVSSPEGLGQLVPYLLNILKCPLTQDSLSEERFHWIEEILDMLAKTGLLCTHHLPTDMCILNAAEQRQFWALRYKMEDKITMTYSTALADLYPREKYFRSFIHSESTEESELTSEFQHYVNIQVRRKDGHVTPIGRPQTLRMKVRRLLNISYLDDFRILYGQEKVVSVRAGKYVWDELSNTLYISRLWTAKMDVPLLVLAYFGLVYNQEVYQAFSEQNSTHDMLKGSATTGGGGAAPSFTDLNKRTKESFPENLPTGFGCIGDLASTTIGQHGICHTPQGQISVGNRGTYSDPPICDAVYETILKIGEQVVSPFMMNGLYDDAIPKRYAYALDVEVYSPLPIPTKLHAFLLLLIELTARPYGSSLWKDLKTWDCLQGNCKVKTNVCQEVCNWLGLETLHILWKKQKHALVATYLNGKPCVIEATRPPLDINPIHARHFITWLGSRPPGSGTVIGTPEWIDITTRIGARHPELIKYVSQPSTPEAPIVHATTDSQEDMQNANASWTKSTRRDFLKKSRR